MTRLARAVAAAALMVAVLPAVALAHPLGNFTINHFAAIRLGADRIYLDVVIDRAEIPAFQARQQLDGDRSGEITPTEREAARVAACDELEQSLYLAVDGAPLPLTATAAGLSFPPGVGGLPTMRLVCQFEATAVVGAGQTIAFRDDSFAGRSGWREIVFDGELAGSTNRLTAYPPDLLAQPLDVRSVEFAAPAGSRVAAWTAPDAQPLGHADGSQVEAPRPAVPGGIDADLASLVNARDLSPIVVIGALLVAVALGAAHAVSPGHGKTIMAAYLVGTRGTVRHALALGMTVTVAHTLGVLLLAVVTLGASAFVAPEALYPVLGLASGALVVAIGGSLLARRLCDVLAGRRHRHAHEHGHEHDHGHEHGHGHGHSHETLRPSRLSWRALFALGLSGGLVPSASALLLLLGSISAGRLGYGVLLVLAFGAGMAVVLGGVGLLLVHATRLIDRLPARRLSGLTSSWLQLGAAALVLVIGVALTGQALTQAF